MIEGPAIGKEIGPGGEAVRDVILTVSGPGSGSLGLTSSTLWFSSCSSSVIPMMSLSSCSIASIRFLILLLGLYRRKAKN